jgi:hypothetical protein
LSGFTTASQPNAGYASCYRTQQVQHIIGMPLQLIIIGMLQSFIIFIISAQQLLSMSMLIPGIGMTLHIMQSASTRHSTMHFIDGIGMPIIGIVFIIEVIGIIAMPAWDMHIIDRLAQCIIIGMPQFIIIDIMSALFLNIAMSMPAAGIILHCIPSSSISQLMVAIIIGMPIIGMLVFIGICICMAFIMFETLWVVGLELFEAVAANSREWRLWNKMTVKQRNRALRPVKNQ